MKTFLIFLLVPISLFARVEKIDYRGWSDVYKLSNDSIDVIIVAESGGRLMNYSHKGRNIIWENPNLDGKTLNDYRAKAFDPDGGRFDYGPEAITRTIHDITWMGAWTAEIVDANTLRITSPEDPGLGLESVREFTLDPQTSHLSIMQTMTNISSQETNWFFWGRTLVPSGGLMLVPTNPASEHPYGWGKYIWKPKPAHIEFDNPQDERVRLYDGFLTFYNSGPGSGKYGTDSHDGWMAYVYDGLLFVKRFENFPEQTYTSDSSLTMIFYTNGSTFGELEPVSPRAALQPNESYSFAEHWWLFDYPAAGDTTFDKTRTADFVANFTDPVFSLVATESVPKEYHLLQIYPNPFNPVTTIRFYLDQPGEIQLSVFNALGQQVEILTQRVFPAGEFTSVWDGSARKSGVYFVRLQSPYVQLVHKILLLK